MGDARRSNFYFGVDESIKPPVPEYRGPFDSLKDVLQKCKDGDRIYIVGQARQLDFTSVLTKSIEIIGIGNAEIQLNQSGRLHINRGPGNLQLQTTGTSNICI